MVARCATTKKAFERHLNAGGDGRAIPSVAARGTRGGAQTSIGRVPGGMGDPLVNLDAVLAAVERMAANQFGALGYRQITVSTGSFIWGEGFSQCRNR